MNMAGRFFQDVTLCILIGRF